MFDFLKKNDSDDDPIKEIIESEDFKELLERSFRAPTDTMTMCAMVLTISLHVRGVPCEMFEELLELMKKAYSELPSPELMKSMMEYGLV